MKKNHFWILLSITILLFAGCSKKDVKKDDTPPKIDLSIEGVFPDQCSELKRGTTVTMKVKLTDDMELGSYGVDIHNNFDHHSHSTEIGLCSNDPVKEPDHPFLLIKNWDIPAGKTEYITDNKIQIPADVDTGDYHFMITVTDKAGWNTIKGLSVRIVK